MFQLFLGSKILFKIIDFFPYVLQHFASSSIYFLIFSKYFEKITFFSGEIFFKESEDYFLLSFITLRIFCDKTPNLATFGGRNEEILIRNVCISWLIRAKMKEVGKLKRGKGLHISRTGSRFVYKKLMENKKLQKNVFLTRHLVFWLYPKNIFLI